jgi:putative DNA-invertase from lambdoid prophage Rac
MKYAFGYLRVSTEEQTILNQKLVIKKWASDNDYDILDFFADSAVSGKIPAINRAGFREMLNLVRTDNVDAVIVYELSRVGRTFWETLEAIKSIEEFAPLISCSPKEVFLQTTDISVRKLMIGILTWVAEREREILIQRTRDGMQRARICSLNYYHKIFHVIRLQKIWECQRLLYINKFIILLTNLKIFY